MTTEVKPRGIEDVGDEDCACYQINYGAFREGISSSEVVSYYDRWADRGAYEQDLCPKRYSGPRIAAESVNKYFTVKEHANIKILDVAAGTGLVGEELLKLGYTNVDALDPSAGMLAVARQKGIYRNYIIGSIGNKTSSVNDDVYDVMTIAGGLGEGHIPCEGLRDMARVVKPGGVAVITIREEYMDYVDEYKDRLEPLMAQMEIEGKWRREERTVCPGYAFGKSGVVFVYRVTA